MHADMLFLYSHACSFFGSPAKAYVYAWIFVIPPRAALAFCYNILFQTARDSVLRMDTVCPGLQSAPGPVPPAKFHSQIQQPRFIGSDSAARTLAARFQWNHPSLFHSPSPLSLSISLTPHFLSPGLDFFDRGILCHEIAMSHDPGMVMTEKLKSGFKAAGRWLKGTLHRLNHGALLYLRTMPRCFTCGP